MQVPGKSARCFETTGSNVQTKVGQDQGNAGETPNQPRGPATILKAHTVPSQNVEKELHRLEEGIIIPFVRMVHRMLQEAQMVPVHKKTQCKYYRGISLISVPVKVLH